jgi:hypothetical protein
MARYVTTQSDFVPPGRICDPEIPDVELFKEARLVAVNWILSDAEIQIHPDGYQHSRWMLRDVIGYFLWTWEVA